MFRGFDREPGSLDAFRETAAIAIIAPPAVSLAMPSPDQLRREHVEQHYPGDQRSGHSGISALGVAFAHCGQQRREVQAIAGRPAP